MQSSPRSWIAARVRAHVVASIAGFVLATVVPTIAAADPVAIPLPEEIAAEDGALRGNVGATSSGAVFSVESSEATSQLAWWNGNDARTIPNSMGLTWEGPETLDTDLGCGSTPPNSFTGAPGIPGEEPCLIQIAAQPKTNAAQTNGDIDAARSGSLVAWAAPSESTGASDCSGDLEIFVFDGDTTQQLTHNCTDDVRPVVGGSTVAWMGCDDVAGASDPIALAELGQNITGHCLRRAQLTVPSWQNDNAPGRSLAFSVASGDWEIYRWRGEAITFDDSHVTQVTENESDDVHLRISESGESLAWIACEGLWAAARTFSTGHFSSVGFPAYCLARPLPEYPASIDLDDTASSAFADVVLSWWQDPALVEVAANPYVVNNEPVFAVSEAHLAWSELPDGTEDTYPHRPDLYSFDGETTTQVTTDASVAYLAVSGVTAAWSGDLGFPIATGALSYWDGSPIEPDGSHIVALTAESWWAYGSEQQAAPFRLSGATVVWSECDESQWTIGSCESANRGDYELHLYDGTESRPWTDNSAQDRAPDLAGTHLTWLADGEMRSQSIPEPNGVFLGFAALTVLSVLRRRRCAARGNEG